MVGGVETMAQRSYLAAWAALIVSLATLAVVVAIATRPEPEPYDPTYELDQLQMSITAISQDLSTLSDRIGADSGYGSGTGLASTVSDAVSAAQSASDTVEELARIVSGIDGKVDSVNAKIEDLCFKLDACSSA